MHGIVIASIQIKDKEKKACFFYEIFLVGNTYIEVILKMFFINLILQM